jgi:hypothetical protein
LITNLNTLEERQLHQEVALYSFIAESGFFAGNFAEISSLIKCAGQRPSFLQLSSSAYLRRKKLVGQVKAKKTDLL